MQSRTHKWMISDEFSLQFWAICPLLPLHCIFTSITLFYYLQQSVDVSLLWHLLSVCSVCVCLSQWSMFLPSGDPVQRLHDVSGSRSCGEDLPAVPRMFLCAAVRSTSRYCVGTLDVYLNVIVVISHFQFLLITVLLLWSGTRKMTGNKNECIDQLKGALNGKVIK